MKIIRRIANIVDSKNIGFYVCNKLLRVEIQNIIKEFCQHKNFSDLWKILSMWKYYNRDILYVHSRLHVLCFLIKKYIFYK